MPLDRARDLGGKWRRYLRFWGANVAEDVQHEIAFHLEALVGEYIARGMPRDQARQLAMQRFGDPTGIARTMQSLAQEREQRMARTEWFHAIDRDVRYALRQLAKRRGFTTVALVTLALGIGANTAIFSAVNAVLLHPVDTHDIDRIMVVRTNLPTMNLMDYAMGPGEALDLMARRELFDAAGAWAGRGAVLTEMGEPQRVMVTRTIGRFFDVFGVAPTAGQLYRPDESEPGSERVAVLSYAFFQQLGGERNIIGKPIVLDGARFEVVGVAPPNFDYPRGTQAYVPQALTPAYAKNRSQMIWSMIGRMKSGVTRAQFDRGIAAEQQRWHRDPEWSYYDQTKQFLNVVPLVTVIAGQLRPVLLVLLGAVGFVLLIACSNIASLQLVHGAGRARELAVRSALGASRRVLVRQLMIENLVVSIGGGLLGLAVGVAIVRLMVAAGASELPALRSVRLDPLVLGFAASATLISGLLFGLLPAARAARINLQESLKEGARNASTGLGRSRLLQASVIVQVALTVMLLLGAGLMIRSLRELLTENPGFDAEHVATYRVSVAGPRYHDAGALNGFFEALTARLGGVPGIGRIGLVSELPFGPDANSSPFSIKGRASDPAMPALHSNMHSVAGDYFAAMGIPLLRGRSFDKTDVAVPNRRAGVAIIDETLAKTFFPNEDPIGKQINQGLDATIVGVVGTVSQSQLGEPPKATIYYPFSQHPWYTTMYVVTRTSLPLGTATPMVRSAIASIDPQSAVFEPRMLDDWIGASLAPRRLAMIVLSGLAALSLGLAVFGLYGVISYAVSQRTTEFGIRMALGAQPGDVRNAVIRQGVVLSCIGVAAGLAAAAIATRALQNLLFGVSSHDPLTFVAAPLSLTAVVIAASYLPARRATRVSPVEALRGS